MCNVLIYGFGLDPREDCLSQSEDEVVAWAVGFVEHWNEFEVVPVLQPNEERNLSARRGRFRFVPPVRWGGQLLF